LQLTSFLVKALKVTPAAIVPPIPKASGTGAGGGVAQGSRQRFLIELPPGMRVAIDSLTTSS